MFAAFAQNSNSATQPTKTSCFIWHPC